MKANFSRYGLFDGRVRFLKGWFKDTLPTAPIERLAILRLDGDMYSSTMDSLLHLYPKLSVGGYVIIDDYGAIAACRRAVDNFRASNQIAASFDPDRPVRNLLEKTRYAGHWCSRVSRSAQSLNRKYPWYEASANCRIDAPCIFYSRDRSKSKRNKPRL